jgi:ankyrin repeat protein
MIHSYTLPPAVAHSTASLMPHGPCPLECHWQPSLELMEGLTSMPTPLQNDIQTLVTAGADVNIVSDLGNTPLHSAAMSGQTEAVKLLLEVGANPSLKNEFNQVPADVAELGGYREITDLLTGRNR